MVLLRVWTVAAVLAAALVVGLAWTQVRHRRATPRRRDVNWPAAILLELTVVAAAVEDLMLVGVVYGGPPGARLSASLLPGTAVSIAGFAGSIALLALHRRRAPNRPATFLWRRIGVAAAGAIGFAVLASLSASLSASLERALTPSVLSVLAGPALTTLLGITLLTYAFSIARVPRQREAIELESESARAGLVDHGAAEEPAASAIGSRPDRWDLYRPPTDRP